jgi:hypothetical protein
LYNKGLDGNGLLGLIKCTGDRVLRKNFINDLEEAK